MSRQMHGDQAAAFRAVIVWEYPEGLNHWDELRPARTVTMYFGPYATKAVARAAATREANLKQWEKPAPIVTSRVEMSSIEWEPVDADA